MSNKTLILGIILVFVGKSLADPNDFVNPKYVVAAKDDGKTQGARDRIVRDSKSSAKKGPWTITNSQVRAASGDPRDYLSWAPYHWPNCNWCGKTNTGPADPDTEKQQVRSRSEGSEEQPPEGFDTPASNNGSKYFFDMFKRHVDHDDPFRVAPNSSLGSGLLDMMGDIFDLFLGIEKQELDPTEGASPATTQVLEGLESIRDGIDQLTETLTADNGSATNLVQSPTETDTTESKPTVLEEHPHTHQPAARDLTLSPASTSSNPALAMATSLVHTSVPIASAPLSSTTSSPASPSSPEELPLRAHRSTKSCAQSPTTSMSPQATWTACPYKPRDGKVNPDTREIKNPAYVIQMSQSVLWNAIAAVASGSKLYEKSAVDFINAFFLDNKSRMNPKVEFGQVVRGPPGTQAGSYMGVLDMRSLVKVVNAVLVLRETQSSYWTQDLDVKMKTWATQYVQWVEASSVGKKAARAANNHGSFYPNQIAALKILSEDIPGARLVLQSYFDNQFQDQIVASGEQPLEAVRTRPFHYRCFNLEAIITNAKLGDYIGINYWSVRTKYGATIQTAVDYLISLEPGNERVEDALPHVAAVAAAYGDPRSKYVNYLKSGNRNYDKKSYWFYDQPAAISNKPKGKRGVEDGALPTTDSPEALVARANPEDPAPSANPDGSPEPESVDAAGVDQDHPPAMFANGRLVELEEGLFVGWDNVREFYRKSTSPIRSRAYESEKAMAPPPMFQDGKTVTLEDGLDVGWDDVSSFYGPNVNSISV
ncbi:alginate lyase [Rhizoctonia solani AG-3 Rhs1AP]|uniref:Alginate lyase n=1 Tax=Rhizoctonia solani AG-3 Rhs1AP TaxID=1086054 RepID=X8IVK0_9AGAM|nr:alginate lyase [Rhizoctonia solani AG-3 Rhs1AP]